MFMSIQLKDAIGRYSELKSELGNIVIEEESSVESIEAALSVLKYIENTLYVTADLMSERV